MQWLPAAGEEPALAGLHGCEPVFFWHGDRVRLPAGAVLLASSLACREQAFRLGPHAWGLQFHAEITPELARSWVAAGPEFVRRAHGATGVERSVTYNKADPGRLLQVIRSFEERCAAASGGGARRFAIRGGGL